MIAPLEHLQPLKKHPLLLFGEHRNIHQMTFLRNWRGGLLGMAIVLFLSTLVYLTAFMAAFGNPTPTNQAILDAVATLHAFYHPLIIYPLAYAIGAFLEHENNKEIPDAQPTNQGMSSKGSR